MGVGVSGCRCWCEEVLGLVGVGVSECRCGLVLV